MKVLKQIPELNKQLVQSGNYQFEISTTGRPLFDGKDIDRVLGKLEDAFANGCTDGEACLYADISKEMLINFYVKCPEFYQRRKELRDFPVLTARTTVMSGLKKDPKLAWEYLRKVRQDEFGDKVVNVNVDLNDKQLDDMSEDELRMRIGKIENALKSSDQQVQIEGEKPVSADES